jgi:mono/diheme cytochrome c family protein
MRGKDIFQGTCERCHDADGKAPIYGERGDKSSLGWIVRQRPEQAVHKIRNGVPGADMLSLRFLNMESLSGLLAYLQKHDPAQ